MIIQWEIKYKMPSSVPDILINSPFFFLNELLALLHSLWDERMQDISRENMQIYVRMRNEKKFKCLLVSEVSDTFREAVPFWIGTLLS